MFLPLNDYQAVCTALFLLVNRVHFDAAVSSGVRRYVRVVTDLVRPPSSHPPPHPLFPPPSPSHAPPLLNPPFLLSVHQLWTFLRTGRAPRASDVQGGHLLRPQVLTATASSVSPSVGPLNQGRQALTDWGSGEQTIAPLSASAGYVLGSEWGKKERKKERD